MRNRHFWGTEMWSFPFARTVGCYKVTRDNFNKYSPLRYTEMQHTHAHTLVINQTNATKNNRTRSTDTLLFIVSSTSAPQKFHFQDSYLAL